MGYLRVMGLAQSFGLIIVHLLWRLNTLLINISALFTRAVNPLLSGHPLDLSKCPLNRDVR